MLKKENPSGFYVDPKKFQFYYFIQIKRGCVKTLAQPFSIIYSPVIFSFVYAAFFSFIW